MKSTLTPATVTPSTFPALFVEDATDNVWIVREVRSNLGSASFHGVLIHNSSIAADIGMHVELGNLCGMSRFNGSITLENDK